MFLFASLQRPVFGPLRPIKKLLKKRIFLLTNPCGFSIIQFARLGGVAQLARARGSYPRCHRFKSSRRYQKTSFVRKGKRGFSFPHDTHRFQDAHTRDDRADRPVSAARSALPRHPAIASRSKRRGTGTVCIHGITAPSAFLLTILPFADGVQTVIP